MGLHPQHLQLGMVGLREREAFDDAVHLLEVALVKVDQSFGFEDAFIAV